MALEEERDSLQAKYLRNQTTIAELRACLEQERSGKRETNYMCLCICRLIRDRGCLKLTSADSQCRNFSILCMSLSLLMFCINGDRSASNLDHILVCLRSGKED